ncbi:hypothetical protein A2U01_0090789, partial [Trifolium medium]|nr:hypothetical protein [Trifolium medium]
TIEFGMGTRTWRRASNESCTHDTRMDGGELCTAVADTRIPAPVSTDQCWQQSRVG